MATPGPNRPTGDASSGDDLAMIRAVIGAAVVDIADRLGRDSDEVTTDRLIDHLRSVLATASWPGEEYSVRRDRGSEAATGRGTWRFDLLIERPDRVLAVIEVLAQEDDLEGRAMALARLSRARGRGIAETAFLFVAEPAAESQGTGGSASPSLPLRPIAEALAAGQGGRRWRLALLEPEASEGPIPGLD